MVPVKADISTAMDMESRQQAPSRKFGIELQTSEATLLLKKGIWLYFFLLLFEGGLRKWVAPGLATPLLVIRDPLVVWMLFVAWQNEMLPTGIYPKAMAIVGALSLFLTMLVGHGNLQVAIFGARILLLHFPFMFLIGKIFDREDVILMGKTILVIAIPMTILIGLQFYSPQSAWVNRGIGGDTATGASGALGYFRPPGTFSFVTGNTQFFSVVAAFVVYFWLNPGAINRIILIAASVCMFASIPFSISRTLLFQVPLCIAFAIAAVAWKPKYWGKMIVVVLAIGIILPVLSKISIFSNATEALTVRFDSASEAEGGLEGTFQDRFLGSFLAALTSTQQPFFGYGLGLGTNVGARLTTGTNDVFLIAEEEWSRMVGEMGTLIGLTAIFIRTHFCYKLVIESGKKLFDNDLLPWLLISVSLLMVVKGQWGQPTALGFSTITGGLTIAALKIREAK